MKYEGVTCPVCGEVFDKDSDVVVCPECGTPHHRTCYATLGNCISAEKHGGDFAWVNPIAPATPVVEVKKKSAPIDPANLNKENMPKNGVIGEMSTDSMGMPTPNYREIRGDEKIGDFTVDEYARVIKTNVPKFMPRFLMMGKTGKKITWNWAAFFFGPFYMAYRKMYKYAALLLLVIYIIPFICFTEVNEYYKEVQDIYIELLTSDAYETSAEMEAAISDMEANIPAEPQALVVSSYIKMGVDVFCGLFANYLYMKKCTKILEKSKAIADPSARERYLKRRGGRSILSVLAVVAGFYVVTLLLVYLYILAGTDIATVLRRFIK